MRIILATGRWTASGAKNDENCESSCKPGRFPRRPGVNEQWVWLFGWLTSFRYIHIWSYLYMCIYVLYHIYMCNFTRLHSQNKWYLSLNDDFICSRLLVYLPSLPAVFFGGCHVVQMLMCQHHGVGMSVVSRFAWKIGPDYGGITCCVASQILFQGDEPPAESTTSKISQRSPSSSLPLHHLRLDSL